MKLGGHETFYLRPGWLTKGLLYLTEGHHGVFSTPEAADDLGVGRNMAKSIGWWLAATGLAVRSKPKAPLTITAFGKVVARHDPFMAKLGTWWFLHAVSQTARTGTTLPWFFHPQRAKRIERVAMIEDLTHELTKAKGKPPPSKSVQREVAMVLQAYAVPVPKPVGDPEDNLGSPFHRLSLLRHLRSADRFELSEATPVPIEVLGLLLSALQLSQPCAELEEGVKLSVADNGIPLARAGSILGRSREALLDLVALGSETPTPNRMDVRFLAGGRDIAMTSAQSATWAQLYYDRVTRSEKDLAA